MREKLIEALKRVHDSYDDFVDGICRCLDGNGPGQQMVFEYLQTNPQALTDDIIEFVFDALQEEKERS